MMSATQSFSVDTTPVAVSTAGGQARHSRVQVQESPKQPWRCYGTFVRIDKAQECVRLLTESGKQARVIHFAIAPVAG